MKGAGIPQIVRVGTLLVLDIDLGYGAHPFIKEHANAHREIQHLFLTLTVTCHMFIITEDNIGQSRVRIMGRWKCADDLHVASLGR